MPAPIHERQDVKDFLGHVANLGDRVRYLEHELAETQRDLVNTKDRLRIAERENERVSIERRQYESGYCILRAQLEVLVTTVIGSRDSVILAAQAAIKNTADEMRRAGVRIPGEASMPTGEAEVVVSSEDVATIRKFGANNRPEED